MGQGTLVNATLINAPSPTKNKDRKRDPDRHSTKKGNQYYFGMRAHIGIDQDSGAVHSITGIAANISDISETHKLLHGEEKMIYGDAGYTGLEKREEMKDCKTTMHIAMKRGKLKKLLEEDSKEGELTVAVEKEKAGIRAYAEHPLRILKHQFGYQETRYRGLIKNTAQLYTLFALGNLYHLRKALMSL